VQLEKKMVSCKGITVEKTRISLTSVSKYKNESTREETMGIKRNQLKKDCKGRGDQTLK
jgi:hypothetical protein